MSIRPINFSSQATPAMEGAGVHLHRVFGFGETEPFDPFLMMTQINTLKAFHGIRIEALKPLHMY